jgi:uncharacterized protein (TIGR03435 family)
VVNPLKRTGVVPAHSERAESCPRLSSGVSHGVSGGMNLRTVQKALAKTSFLIAISIGLSTPHAATQDRRPAFEVASVRQNRTDGDVYMNVPTPLENGPVPGGGLYSAHNIKLIQYLMFAYSLTQIQVRSVVSQAPWITEDRFDIEARAAGNPTMADYRLMMQSLLADRFKLTVHVETRTVPIYAVVLAKPNKLGPYLRLHRPNDLVCAKPSVGPAYLVEADSEGFPLHCGGPMTMKPSASGRMKNGGRDVPIKRFAAILTGVGEVDRPIVDETGIKGTVDYSLEWAKAIHTSGLTPDSAPDPDAPSFQEALKEQMGIKLVSKKGPQELFFIDHIEKPSAN